MFNLKHKNIDLICTPTILNNKNKKSLGFICESNKWIEGFQNQEQSLFVKNMPGLVGWFDSKDPNLTGIVPVDGTPIGIWKDKSYNTNDFFAKIPGKRLNNGIKFTSSVYQSNKPYSYPIHVYIVIKLDMLNKPNDVIGLSETSLTTDQTFNSLTYSEYKLGYWHNGSEYLKRTPNAISMTPETSTDTLIMEWSIGNNNYKIFRNGVQIMFNNTYTYQPYASPDLMLLLGSRSFSNISNLLNGTVYEVLIYNRQINDVERNAVFNYLDNKWLKLPSNFIGCYRDSSDRAIKKQHSSLLKCDPDGINCRNECESIAVKNGHNIFGLQAGEELRSEGQVFCFTDKDPNYAKYGKYNGDCSLIGRDWMNAVYKINSIGAPAPESELQRKPQSYPEAERKPQAKPEAERKPQSYPEAERKPQSYPEVERKPQSYPEVEHKPKPQSYPEVERKPEPKQDLQLQPQTKVIPRKPEPDIQLQPQMNAIPRKPKSIQPKPKKQSITKSRTIPKKLQSKKSQSKKSRK